MVERLDTALEDMIRGMESGRLAHAYLIQGDPRGDGVELVLRVLERAMPEDGATDAALNRRLRARTHPDVYWVEPESKSRRISLNQIQDMCRRLHDTSYEGGRRAGIIQFADRLGDEAANAFLKTLEEPPAQCLLFLVTEHPESLLPTIVSRCQQVLLHRPEAPESAPWLDDLLVILRRGAPGNTIHVFEMTAAIEDLLAREEKRIEEAEPKPEMEGEEARKVRDARIQSKLLEMRRSLLRHVMYWRRDVLFAVLGRTDQWHFTSEEEALSKQAEGLTRGQCERMLEEVERLNRRLESNLPVTFAVTAALLKQGLAAASA